MGWLCCVEFFSLILFALLLCYCSAPPLNSRGLSHSDDSQVDPRTASLAAFDTHVRPALSVCAGCHGNKQAPLFVVEDTATRP